MDLSTIDLEKLHRLPIWESPGGKWSVSQSPGMGCYGDPPGYPSYFLRAVYFGGNTSHRKDAPDVVIADETGAYRIVRRVDTTELWDERLRSLWIPLPMEHERTQLWIRATYRHLKHCYRDDGHAVTERNDNGLLIYPLPYYRLRTFEDDPRFSDAWRNAERQAVEAHNADVTARAAQVAIPDNHAAVRVIRKFYPEHAPDLSLIADPGMELEGDWWETEAQRPSIDECRPRNGRNFGADDHATQWCQWCGRKAGES